MKQGAAGDWGAFTRTGSMRESDTALYRKKSHPAEKRATEVDGELLPIGRASDISARETRFFRDGLDQKK